MTETAPYQGMSPAVIAEMLAYIQAFDKSFVPDELDVRAFHAVAQDNRWNHHEALATIRKWGGNHPEGQRLDPALLNRLIRMARQDQMSRQAAPQPGDRAAVDGTGEAVGDDPDWGQNNSAALEQVHREANVVACPACHAEIEARCKNTLTGNATKIPHLKRMRAAGIGGRSSKINKAMVLKHPDLIAELRKPPCSFTSPENWGGYLPPERGPDGQRNGSIYRRQLAAIVAEAERREAT
jgi:hypothetical protein